MLLRAAVGGRGNDERRRGGFHVEDAARAVAWAERRQGRGSYLAPIAAAMPDCNVPYVVMPRRSTPRCTRTWAVDG